MSAISAKNGRVQIGGVDNTSYAGGALNLISAKWSVEVKADEVDVSTFETNGYYDYITGFIDAHISVDSFWDKDNVPQSTKPQIIPGARLYQLRLYQRRDAAVNFLFAEAIVITASNDVSVHDAIRYSFTARNKGLFVYPTGTQYVGTDE